MRSKANTTRVGASQTMGRMVMALLVCIATMPVVSIAQEPAAAAPRTEARTALVNLNTATSEQLESLPDVGPSMASRIVECREKNGPFKQFLKYAVHVLIY